MKKPTKKTAQILLVILLIFLGWTGNWLLKASRPPMKKREVPVAIPPARTMAVHTHTIPVPIRGHGTVRPLQEIQLVPQVGGKVIRISPALVDGGAFKKGDTLLAIDPADYRIAVTLAEARVKDAESKFVLAEQESAVARSDWQQLHPGTEPPPLVAKKPQLETARANLAAQRAELERARLNLARTRLKAPFDGRVSQKNVDIGQYVSPGQPAAVLYSIEAAEIVMPMESDKLAWFHVPGFTTEGEVPVEPVSAAKAATRLFDITLRQEKELTIVSLRGDGRFDQTDVFMLGPEKLVVDLFGISSEKMTDVIEADGGCLDKIRMALHRNPEKKVRVVLDLGCEIAYAVKEDDNTLDVRMASPEKAALLSLPEESLLQTAASPAPPESSPVTKATVHVDIAGRRHTWEGVVVRAEGKVDERTRMINVVVRVDAPYSRKPPLAPGLFATVDIDGRPIAQGTVIPRAALRPNDIVWVVDDNGRLRFRPVEVALHAHSGVVIKGGLKDEEQVVVSPIKEVTDGMMVRNVPANNGGEAS